MTLPADALAQLQGALAPMGTTGATVTWSKKTAGAFGQPANLAAVIVSDETTQETDERSHERVTVRRLTINPLAAAAASLGDRVTYAAVDFTIAAISSLDVPTWVCEVRAALGAGARDRFRAVGGGS